MNISQETINLTQEQGASDYTTPLRYCLYARKSSEEDERQAMSIESQVNEMLQIAQAQGLNIVEIRREAHSAKASGMRPEFNTFLLDIASGHFDALLTWAPDRLSRNAGDLGSLVDLMDQGHLKEIRTHGQTFTNSPNEKFLLMILGSQAKLENDHRSLNVKRGLRAKAQSGWRPGMPPLGYNIMKAIGPNDKKIVIDPERAPVIQEMFKKIGYYGYSGRMLIRWIEKETTFTTRTGKQLHLSGVYRILTNPFYYGQFEYPSGSGKWYNGLHDPLVTKELFDSTQENLQLPSHKRAAWGSKDFGYTQVMHCGGCGSGITAEEKFKNLKDGTKKRYVYYRCSKKRNLDCNEKYIREEELLKQLLKLIDEVDINPIATQRKFQIELERFKKFARGFLGQLDDSTINQKQIDMRMYLKYILQEGSSDEKRSVLNCLHEKIFLKNQKISS